MKENYSASLRRVTRPPVTLPREIPFHDLVAYTDASYLQFSSDVQIGDGVVIYQARRIIFQKAIPFSPTMTIFDAEALSALTAVEEALLLPSARFENDVWILLDNQEVAHRLLNNPVCSSQNAFIQFLDRSSKWPLRTLLPHTRPGKVRVYWIPGHTGILGNEKADFIAREARHLTPPSSSTHSFGFSKAWAKEMTNTSINEYWKNSQPQSYKVLSIDSFDRLPRELDLPRPLVAHLYAARTGHGDFAAYHERFNHQDALYTCSCGSPKSPKHFLSCPKPTHRLPRPPSNSLCAAQYYLGTHAGAKIFIKWLCDTKFYTIICPRILSETVTPPLPDP